MKPKAPKMKVQTYSRKRTTEFIVDRVGANLVFALFHDRQEIKITRKSLTLVRVGPVSRSAPARAKKV
jgi:hypothetical protein